MHEFRVSTDLIKGNHWFWSVKLESDFTRVEDDCDCDCDYLRISSISGPGYLISIVFECPGDENVFKQSTRSPKLIPNLGLPSAPYSYFVNSFSHIKTTDNHFGFHKYGESNFREMFRNRLPPVEDKPWLEDSPIPPRSTLFRVRITLLKHPGKRRIRLENRNFSENQTNKKP